MIKDFLNDFYIVNKFSLLIFRLVFIENKVIDYFQVSAKKKKPRKKNIKAKATPYLKELFKQEAKDGK